MRYADLKPGLRVWAPRLGAFGVVVTLEPEHWEPQTVTVRTARFAWPVSWVVADLVHAGPVVARA